MSIWLHIVTNPVYLIACLIVGFAGRKRRTGMFGYAVMSFLLTPLVMMFVLYVGGEKPVPDDDDLLDEPLPAPTEKRRKR